MTDEEALALLTAEEKRYWWPGNPPGQAVIDVISRTEVGTEVMHDLLVTMATERQARLTAQHSRADLELKHGGVCRALEVAEQALRTLGPRVVDLEKAAALAHVDLSNAQPTIVALTDRAERAERVVLTWMIATKEAQDRAEANAGAIQEAIAANEKAKALFLEVCTRAEAAERAASVMRGALEKCRAHFFNPAGLDPSIIGTEDGRRHIASVMEEARVREEECKAAVVAALDINAGNNFVPRLELDQSKARESELYRNARREIDRMRAIAHGVAQALRSIGSDKDGAKIRDEALVAYEKAMAQ